MIARLQKIRKMGGFSLPELVVTMAIFVILCGFIFIAYRTGVDAWRSGQVFMTIQEDIRRALSRMSTEIHQGSFNSPSGVNASGSNLTFEIRKADGTWKQIRYYLGGLNGAQILRQMQDPYDSGVWSQPTVVANNIQTLTFSWDNTDPRTIAIDITATRNDMSGRTLQFHTTRNVTMRN